MDDMWLYFYIMFRDWKKNVHSPRQAVLYIALTLAMAVPVALVDHLINIFFAWLRHQLGA